MPPVSFLGLSIRGLHKIHSVTSQWKPPPLGAVPGYFQLAWVYITLNLVFCGLPFVDQDFNQHFNQQTSKLQQPSPVIGSMGGEMFLLLSFISLSLSSPKFFFSKCIVCQTKKIPVSALVRALLCMDQSKLTKFKCSKLKFVKNFTLSTCCFKNWQVPYCTLMF